jgi:sterol desaturase/sphingolipid hydroxylase (fatty acid hydroxylase superfamily)
MRVAIGLVILGLAFALLERRWAVRWERRVDLTYWFFNPFVSRPLASICAGLLLLAMGRPGSHWFASQPLALQWIEVLVGADLSGYWSHRLFHRGLLWRFHAIHHSSGSLDWLAAARVHPLNEAISRVLQLFPLLLLGFDPRVLAAAVPFLTFYAVLLHANVRWDFGPLRYAIASPRFHRWHHTSESEGLDKNFAGLFPWIDALFGTLYMPAGREPKVFGAGADVIPSGFLGQLAYPFRTSRNSG